MSEKLSSVIEAGGDFITRSVSGGSVSSGSSGDIITLTPPADQRIRLTHLSTVSGVQENNISIFVGADDVTGVVSIKGDAPTYTGQISIGSYQPYAAGNPPSANHRQLTFGKNEVVVIRKNTGTTTNTVYYGYEAGL